jgi:hypothetical protein
VGLTPGFFPVETCLVNSPLSSINPKTQLKSDFGEREAEIGS